jgi:prepilin-type N-terminal cleavage/methylation domain-containing protein
MKMWRSFRRIIGKQGGFTAVEMLIGVAIIGIIGAAIATSVTQVFSGSNTSSNQMTAINNVRNAGDWIVRDAEQAQASMSTSIGSGVLGLASADSIQLAWVNKYSTPNHTYIVSYTIPDGTTDLVRTETVDGVAGNPVVVARNITQVSRTFEKCKWSTDPNPVCLLVINTLTIDITSTVGPSGHAAMELRTFKIQMRPAR